MRDLIDSTGTIQNHIVYDSYGNITAQTNPVIDTCFGYTGRELDAETGQYYYRARYYDAGVSRFISEDSIGFAAFDTNLYRYVGNSPANFTDPSGLIVANLVGAGVGALTDLGLQLATNGGNISKVDWASVAVSTATGSLGVGLTAKIASLSTSAAKRIAWNAAGNAVLGAGDRLIRNALEGKCLDDNLLPSALVGGALGAAGEAASIAASRITGSLSGALGGVDDAILGSNQRGSSPAVQEYWDEYYRTAGAQGDDLQSLINSAERRGITITPAKDSAYDPVTREIELSPNAKKWEFFEEFLHKKAVEGWKAQEISALTKELRKVKDHKGHKSVAAPGRSAEEIIVKEWLISHGRLVGVQEPEKVLLQNQINQLRNYGTGRGY